MEYIIVEDGLITAHKCGASKPDGAVAVPDGFAGYVGLKLGALKDDLSGLKPLSQQISEGVVGLPEGYKINETDNEFIRMEQMEIDEKYPIKTYAAEGSFEAIEVRKTFDRNGNFEYWPPENTVEMSGKQPGPAYRAVSGQWVLDDDKAAEVAMTEAKAERTEAVSKITVEVDGMIFDGDEKAQERMSRTVAIATANGLPMTAETTWVLANNMVAQVTLQQLAQACLLAGQKQTELWTIPYEQAN